MESSNACFNVEIDCAAVRDGGDVLRGRVMELVAQVAAPLLGAAEVDPDHAALGAFRSRLETCLPAGSFELATALGSQAERQYTLVIRDRRPARAA